MSESLVGFLLVGPVNISLSRKTVSEIIKEADRRIEICRTVNNGTYKGKKLPEFLDYEEDALFLSTFHGEVIVKDFINLWNKGEVRDIQSRTATIGGEEVGIVFCGELTWGDEPAGTGYNTIRPVHDLGLLPLFGVR